MIEALEERSIVSHVVSYRVGHYEAVQNILKSSVDVYCCTAGFTTLDLDLLEEVLHWYDLTKLWAATGWFLERFQKSFHVADALLTRMEERRPRSRLYVERDQRGGTLVGRWNLILPKPLLSLGEPNER